ncbi:MAG TPA: globin [Roseiflexaceae bacterium]|nr:globin [Roseiflexaceae bacterium]
MAHNTIYELAGGDEPFRRLVDAFYARVERDPLLRPLFPADLAPGKERQFLFITQYFGGPPRYSALRGHPRLRARHLPFPIGRAERDAWVGHMLAAIDEAGFTGAARQALVDYFERTATFLINNEPGQLELRG